MGSALRRAALRLRRASWRGPAAVCALAAVLAAGTALALAGLRGATPWHAAVHVPWWGLAAGFALAEVCVVHVHFRSSAHTYTFAELPLVIGLMFTAPAHVPLAWALGAGIVVIVSRYPLVRVAFNVAALGASAFVGVALFHLLAPAGTAVGPAVWAAALVAVSAAGTASSLLVLGAMATSGETVHLAKCRRVLAEGFVVSVVNAALGLAVAVVLAADALGAVLLVAPAAIIFIAYRAYSSERRKHTELEFLYAAGAALSGAQDAAAGLAGVLAMAVEALRAPYAEAYVRASGEDDAAWRVTVTADGSVTSRAPVPEGLSAALREAVADKARVVRWEEVPPHLAAQLRDHGLPAGMIAGLRGEGGVIGALFVANRDGVAAPFDAEEVRLCGTLAAHVGSWLGQDRLEHRVSELRESQAELYHQAFHDPLTGLANRLLFTDRVRHALTRRSGSATVIYIDLDDFKPVNDTLGHDAGDQLLCAVAERLRDSLRPADTAARLGGDEFAVLLTDVAPNDAVTVANRILRAFGKPLEIAGRPQTISASLGIATGACGELDGDQLVSNADAAMYVSKHGGKRGVSVHGGAERDPAADPPIGRSVPEPRAPVAQPVGGNGNR